MSPVELIAHEARLLDERRHDEWLALFTPDCRYWVPLQGAAQQEGASYNALADEDHLLLELRVERLKNPRAHHTSAQRCQHVLQASAVTHEDASAAPASCKRPSSTSNPAANASWCWRARVFTAS